LTLFQRWEVFGADLGRLAFDVSALGTLIATLAIVNLGTRLTQGAVIRSFGGKVERFGIMLVYGFVPRFFIDRSAIPALDRRGQLWSYGSGLLARLAFFAGGVFLWATYRGTGSWFAELSLLVSQAAMWAFLIEAMPFIPADGYRWLSTYFGKPSLRKKALATLKAKLTGNPLPPMVSREEVPALLFFGVAGILAFFGLVLGLLIYIGIVLEDQFRGAGVVMFLGLVASFVIWMIALRASFGRRERPALAPEMAQGLLAGRTAEPDAEAARATSPLTRGRVVWAVIAAVLLAVAFLPYRYEASGTFQIMPTGRTQATARTDGEIVEVLVREGDWVEKGDLLARLSSWDQQRDVDVTRAQLAKSKADLAELEAGPKPEEIALAESQVESARSKVTYSKAEADRFKKLVASGTISQAEWEKSNTTYETNLAELAVAEANLELVKSGATANEIEAARAEVERLTHLLAYHEDQLERTNIRAPAPGRVITPNVELLGGTGLEIGDEFLQLDDTRVVEAQIDVPETDIELIRPGDTVRVKAWGYSDREIAGVVTSVSPAAEERDYGQVVRAKASIPNTDAFLRPGMTGYAKLDGQEMRVWEAYLRFFIRFFTVEVWSWIP
jgi:multidrug resistance efflux pump